MDTPPSPKHVFISYSRRDEVVTSRIVAYLRKKGIKVWVDNEKLIPGTPIWEEEIEKAIKGASAIIVVLSPESKNSEWVRREITLTEQYGKLIFPVLVKGDENTSISLRLITRQFVDMREDQTRGLQSLYGALKFYFEEKEPQDISHSAVKQETPVNPQPTLTSTQKKSSNKFWVAGIVSGLFALGIVLFSLGKLAFSSLTFNNPTETATATYVAATYATAIQKTTATHTSTPEHIKNLVTDTACTVLLTPEDKTNVPVVGTITFGWEAMPSAVLYHLQITMPNGGKMDFKSANTKIIRYAESTPLGGEYQWQITAYNANGESICTSDTFRYSKPEYVKSSRGGGEGQSCVPPPQCGGGSYDPVTCQCK